MNSTDTKIASALAVCPRFRWLSGMLTTRYGRVEEQVSIGLRNGDVRREPTVRDPDDFDGIDRIPVPENALPDLDDPVTTTALLPVFRVAYNDPSAHVVPDGGEWTAWARLDGDRAYEGVGRGPTETAALAAAILAAPGGGP